MTADEAVADPTRTLVDAVRAALLTDPERALYRFMSPGQDPAGPLECQSLVNQELDERIRALAVTLRRHCALGDRALIVCPPGPDYLTAFYACLYAGVIAVPIYPPTGQQLQQSLARVAAVVRDCTPAVALAPAVVAELSAAVTAEIPELNALNWVATDSGDHAPADEWRRPPIIGDDLAFLQYTSGSTGQPKGVMLSHANLLYHLRALGELFIPPGPDQHVLAWLPPYHDMGLIGALLTPLCEGLPELLHAAVSRLSERPTMRIGSLVTRLQSPQARIQVLTHAGVDARTVITRQLHTLTDQELAALSRWVACGRAGAGPATSSALLGVSPALAPVLLEDFAERELILRGADSGRYEIRPLTRLAVLNRCGASHSARPASPARV